MANVLGMVFKKKKTILIDPIITKKIKISIIKVYFVKKYNIYI